MIFTKEELRVYTDIQLHVLASYLKLEDEEGEDREKLIDKIYNKFKSVNSVYELWDDEPQRSIKVQRIYESQKEKIE